MKSRKSKKITLLIIAISLFLLSIIISPFIECSNIDSNIFRKCLLVLSSSILIASIINMSNKKKKRIINFIIIVIGIISSIIIYSGHSKDYKIRNENYFKSIFKVDNKVSSNSVIPVNSEAVVNKDNNLEGELLKVNYIDVGQGDSIFIELPNGETMLIDSGERNYDKKVISYIDTLGYKNI